MQKDLGGEHKHGSSPALLCRLFACMLSKHAGGVGGCGWGLDRAFATGLQLSE